MELRFTGRELISALKTLGSIPHTSKKENLKLCPIKPTMPAAAFHLQEMDYTRKAILAAEDGQYIAILICCPRAANQKQTTFARLANL